MQTGSYSKRPRSSASGPAVSFPGADCETFLKSGWRTGLFTARTESPKDKSGSKRHSTGGRPTHRLGVWQGSVAHQAAELGDDVSLQAVVDWKPDRVLHA